MMRLVDQRLLQFLFISLLQILYLINSSSIMVQAIKWLAISNPTNGGSSYPFPLTDDSPTTCDNLTSQLIKGQLRFCKNHPEFMTSIKSGATKALDECQFQFRSRRWNCSLPNTTKLFKGKRSYTNFHAGLPVRRLQTKTTNGKIPIVPEGTREAAFLHAISAAGVAHSVTKQCSAGNSPNCGCDRSVPMRDIGSSSARGTAPSPHVHHRSGGLHKNFKWAGCSDNIDYGVSLSRTFVDAKDHKMSRKKGNKTSKALMNLHNNEAGRKIITKHMKVDCKCHGVSGSCEIKTCWRVMPNFREIGEILHEKFEQASHVVEKRSGARRILVGKDGRIHQDTDLVFVRSSPDFCEEDLKKGSLGTRGRKCNKNPNSHDACVHLCCSRGFKTQTMFQSTKCNCKFHWCCNVTCSECRRTIEISTCN